MHQYKESCFILTPEEATKIARTLLEANAALARQGAKIPASMIAFANAVYANVKTQKPIEDTGETVEYEQITSAEAAKILGCGEPNVRALARAGRLPGSKPQGFWIFNRSDVVAFRDYRE